LVYDFCVIWNVFHVLNRVHCRLFSVFTAHGPQTQRQKILLAARVSVVLDCCVPDCTERTYTERLHFALLSVTPFRYTICLIACLAPVTFCTQWRTNIQSLQSTGYI